MRLILIDGRAVVGCWAEIEIEAVNRTLISIYNDVAELRHFVQQYGTKGALLIVDCLAAINQ